MVAHPRLYGVNAVQFKLDLTEACMSDPELDAVLNGLLEYTKVLPGNKKHPIEILVLRGHLLIERELRGLIEAKLQRPTAFDLDNMKFSTTMRLAEALYGEAVADWIWGSIKQLNTIRNSLEHHLNDDTLVPRIERVVESFKSRDPKTFKYVKNTMQEQLAYCLADLHHELLKARHFRS